MDFEGSFLAILLGAVLYIIYGTVYYSILLKDKNNENSSPVRYVIAILVAFISSFIMSMVIQHTGVDSMGSGAFIGFLIGILISIVFIKNAAFGLISKRHLFIALGDHLVIFTLLGALHGYFS